MNNYPGFPASAMFTKMDTADETAIRHLFQQLMDAWAAGDAEAYGALFTEDADYIAFDGVNQKGRAAIIAGHKPLFERFLKGSRLTGEIGSLRWLAPDVALAHALGSIIDAGRSTPKPERLSSQTLVAVKEDGVWRFTAFHNTRVRPIGQGVGGLVAWLVADLAWRLLGPKPE
ncbi:MAG: SgcJ/EcaC family oxidoreductase [Caldilineaceae bacterium]